jgi:isoamyl acetate esterase
MRGQPGQRPLPFHNNNSRSSFSFRKYLLFCFVVCFAIILLFNIVPSFTISSLVMSSFSPNRPIAVVFGDSITQQGFSAEKSGWVSLLADYWTRKVDVINRGYSGYNSRLGLQMVRDVVSPLQPAFVTVFFGANDACFEGTLHHVSLENFISNMQGIVSTLKSELSSATIILITPPPVYEPLLGEMNRQKGKPMIFDRSNANTMKYAEAVKDIGMEHGLVVVDLFTVLHGHESANENTRREFLSDGLHLNAKGNVALFNALKAEIQTEYPKWDAEKMEMDRPGWAEALLHA